MKLDPDGIETEAATLAGVDRSGAQGEFSYNLHVAVDSANEEGRLSPAGYDIVRDDILNGLTKRLQADRWIREIPEIGDEVVDRPLFLTGLPRSGTTYCQYLFDNDPAMRLLRTWETARPAPAHILTDEEKEKRRIAADRDGEKLRTEVPGYDALHLNDTDGPDECHNFLNETMGAIGVHNTQNAPSHYRAILEEFDLDAVYRVHKRQLQILQWKVGGGQRWALKYPNHLIAMDNIVNIYPDATFVMTHRDPVQTLASLCKISLAIRRSRSDEVDPHEVGRQMKDFVRVHFERMMASRLDPTMDARVIDVDYYRLASSPEVVMAEIYEQLDIEIPAVVRQAIVDWKRNNPQGKRGANSYSLEAFGLKDAEVAEEYQHYFDRFDVLREAKALERVA